MIEALARIRNDSILSRPVRRAAARHGLVWRTAARVGAIPPRLMIGAVLSALLVGIGVNALLLQRERHPAPLFQPAPARITAPAPIAPAPRPPPAPAPAREAPPPAAVAPAPSPALAPAPAPAAAPRPSDAIGAFLRGEAQPADGPHLVQTAQAALAKLGYPVKPDGAQGATTDDALRAFERAHGLPVTTEITPRLVKQLAAAARAAGR